MRSMFHMLIPGLIRGLPAVQVLIAQEAGDIILAPREGTVIEPGSSKLKLR